MFFLIKKKKIELKKLFSISFLKMIAQWAFSFNS